MAEGENRKEPILLSCTRRIWENKSKFVDTPPEHLRQFATNRDNLSQIMEQAIALWFRQK